MESRLTVVSGVTEIMSEDSPFEEEVVIGVHESGMVLEEGLITGGRSYCANCRRNVHCHVLVDDGKAEIVMTCKNDSCECRCRTHFACKKCGHLHPYGSECTHKDDERMTTSESDKNFEELMEKWKESQKVEGRPKKID